MTIHTVWILYLLFSESTIMGQCVISHTDDLAMLQKMIIDTLHKEDESQRGITEGGGCSSSALSKHIKYKVDWKEEIGYKRFTSNRDDRRLENTVNLSRFKHLGELHKKWTEAGVSASRVTTLRHLQEKSYRTTSETETSSEASYLGYGEKELDCCSVSKALFPDESKFCISFVNQGLRVWRKRGETQNPCSWSPVWSFHSQWWFGLLSSAGVGPLCFLKSTVNHHLPGNIRALHASFCWQVYGDADIILQQDLAPAHQKLVQWPWCYCAWLTSKLTRPEPKESMMRDTRPNNEV